MLRYSYESVFSPYIEGLVMQKKTCGFAFDLQAYLLKKFDEFCLANGYCETLITREIAMAWAVQRDTEGINYRNGRVSALRQLSLYMNSIGIESYIPHQQPTGSISVPHIPDAAELGELFEVIDKHLPDNSYWHRFSMGYQVLFRLYYCCGLRLSEGCYLKKGDVDLRNGILTIVESKGKKSRLVYMSEDLAALCRIYDEEISAYYSDREWFFPGRKIGKPLGKSAIDTKFKEFWGMTDCSKTCGKAPTVHSLRYAFVVHRMNQWMMEGVPLDAMMPYLSRHLGHSGLRDTMYYYHQVSSAFKIVREKDHLSNLIIPEVTKYEE
jgi:integrase